MPKTFSPAAQEKGAPAWNGTFGPKFKAPQGPAPVFQTGIHRPRQAPRIQPSESGVGRGLHVFSKSTSLGTSLATCTFQGKVCLEAGGHARTGHLRPQMATWGNSDGHTGHLSPARRPKLNLAWFASTQTGLLSPRFPRKSSPCMRACPPAHVCRPHGFPSLGGQWEP